MSKKKKQQEAVQRAQKYVSGDKLTKSEVKKLENKGFSSKQIQAVASSVGSVGDKAQGRIDNKHSPSPGSSSGSSGSSRVQTMGGTHQVRVNAQGQAIASKGPSYAGLSGHPKSNNAYLTSQAAKKINNKVSKVEGGSLVGGEGMAVSRYVTVTDPGRRRWPMGSYATVGGGKRQLAIYAPVAQPGKTGSGGKKTPGDKKTPSARTSSGSSSSTSGSGAPLTSTPAPISVGGATGNYATVENLEQEAPEAPNFYDTANSFPVNPNYSPTGSGVGGSGGSSSPIYWDRTAENLFSYSDRLGDHNRQTAQWLSNIGAADRGESDAYLQNFARALPPAPDPNEANESVLSFLEQANKRLGFGKSTMGGVTV